MRKVVIGVLPAVVLWLGAQPARAQRAIYLVRHAEVPPGADNPSLTPAGQERAQALSRLLKDAGVRAIYTSDALRARQTAQPCADALGLTPTVVANGDPAATVAKARAEHAGDVVLIVGHSNTVPDMVARWTHGTPPTIGHDEFDRIFVVTPDGPTRAGVVPFRYAKD